MRIVRTLPIVLLLSLPVPAIADHAPVAISGPSTTSRDVPASVDGEWSFLANFPLGPASVPAAGSDVATFERDGTRYAIVGSMTVGFRIFRWDSFAPDAPPTPVAEYASAFPCTALTGISSIIRNKLAGDRDERDTLAIGGWQNDVAVSGDASLAAIGTDADGRCHDDAGAGAELVDISDPAEPSLVHLTRHFGEAHTLTMDPRRGLLYISSSDAQLNGIDIVDVRSCLGGVDECRPVVARYQFPVPHRIDGATVDVPDAFKDARFPNGLTAGKRSRGNDGCHDITVQGDHLYCAAIDATVIFDASGLMQREPDAATRAGGSNCADPTDDSCVLTGTHLTDEAMVAADAAPGTDGIPGACRIVDGTPGVGRPRSVTDCDVWSRATSGTNEARYESDLFMRANLRNANLRPLSVIPHGGSSTDPAKDISLSHEADPTEDGTMLIVTDERGGGVSNVCNVHNKSGGGAWFYDIRDKANPRLLKTPDGDPGVFLSQETPVPGNCTIHVIQQIPGTNAIAAAWYTQGTHVFTFDADLDRGEIVFEEVGHYIPKAAQTWTSLPIGLEDGVVYLQTGDISRGSDVLAFNLSGPEGALSGDEEDDQGARDDAADGADDDTEVLGARFLPATGADTVLAINLLLTGGAIAGVMRRRRART